MGMYTEFIFGAKTKPNLPKEAEEMLFYLFTGDDITLLPANIPEHPFFKTDRWKWMFRSGGSAYFGAPSGHREMKEHFYWKGEYHLAARGNLKNYSNEIELFLDWIKPYLEQGSGTRDMYAISIYEEASEPTIYYLRDEN